MKLVLCAVLAMFSLPAMGAEEFKDVPKDHWAAESVHKLADAGVVKGYPDGSYGGNKTVTRYELAVTLQRFIEMLQESWKPLVPPTENAPAKASETTKNAKPAVDPITYLRDGGYLPKDSPILKDGSKAVTFNELAQALTAVSVRLTELRVPASKKLGDETGHETDHEAEHKH